MGLIHRKERGTEPKLQIHPQDRANGFPVLFTQVMTERCPSVVRLLIILQHQRVRQGYSRAQGSFHRRFLPLLQSHGRRILQKISILSTLPAFRLFHVQYIRQKLKRPIQRLPAAGQSFPVIHGIDFIHHILLIRIIQKINLRQKSIISVPRSTLSLHCDVRHRKQSRGKIVCRSLRALQPIGIKPYSAVLRNIVLREEPFFFQP